MVIAFLDLPELNQDETETLLQIRYATNAIYAAVKIHSMEPKRSPVASSEKNSTIRYPFITITSAATSQASVCEQITNES